MSQRRTDKGSVRRHLRHSRGEVVAMLIAILCNPRCEQFLQCGQGAGRQHLSPERVCLQLAEVSLPGQKVSILSVHSGDGTYSQISRLSRICLASCERRANLVRQFMLARSHAGDGDPLPYGILLEFDGHGDNGSLDIWRVCRCARLNRRGPESVGKMVRIGERLDVYCVYSSVEPQPRQRSG